MADPASGRCWLFYYPSLTSLLVLLRPVGKPNFNILDPQGPVPRKAVASGRKTLARAESSACSPALCHLGSAVRETIAFLKHLNFAVEPHALSMSAR